MYGTSSGQWTRVTSDNGVVKVCIIRTSKLRRLRRRIAADSMTI